MEYREFKHGLTMAYIVAGAIRSTAFGEMLSMLELASAEIGGGAGATALAEDRPVVEILARAKRELDALPGWSLPAMELPGVPYSVARGTSDAIDGDPSRVVMGQGVQ